MHFEISKEGYETNIFPYKITFDREGVYKINKAMIPLKEPIAVSTETKKIELDLNTLYFDFDSYKLTADALSVLRKNEMHMQQYSSVVLWVNGYADARGEAKYNKELSRKRMLAVIDWFNARSIGERIMYQVNFFGEEDLVNDCTEDSDCSEADHQLNRRVEMKMKGEK